MLDCPKTSRSLTGAEKCGHRQGLYISVLISTIITIITICIYRRSGWYINDKGKRIEKRKTGSILIIGLALVIVSFLVIPFFTRWSNGFWYRDLKAQ